MREIRISRWLFKAFISVIFVLTAVLLSPTYTLAADENGDGVQELGSTIVIGDTNAKNYFYKQLVGREKKFYHAIETMAGVNSCGESHNVSGRQFYSGEDLTLIGPGANSSYALVDSDFYVGKDQLLQEMAAARDAFQYDHPEIFYIDWSYLTLRVYQNQNKETVATLGKGRSDTYYLQGFNKGNIGTKIDEFNTMLNNALHEIRTNASKEAGNADLKVLQRYLATAAHDYVTKHMVYHYEHEVYQFNQPNVEYSNARTAYDALKYHEGVCESYTRLYKALMDQLGVPTICVHGNYRTEEGTNEPHIWNYVQLADQEQDNNKSFCFLVDTTMDDPIKIDSQYLYNDGQAGHWEKHKRTPAGKKLEDSDLNTGIESQYLCLVGSVKTLSTHTPSPYLSAGTKAFAYPSLIVSGFGEVATQAGNGFKVKQVKSSDNEGNFTEFHVSYNGKNYTENAVDGKYIVMRFGQQNANGMEYSDWCYPEIELFTDQSGNGTNPFENSTVDPDLGGHFLQLPFQQVEWIQFAITELEPPYLTTNKDQNQMDKWFFYQGDPKCLLDSSPEITNARDVYKAPPYVVESKPQGGGAINCNVEKPYRMEITYDDILVTENDYKTKGLNAPQAQAKDLGITLFKRNNIDFINKKIDSPKISDPKIEIVRIKDNSTWNANASEISKQDTGDERYKEVTKISFDFMPDKTYADQDALYSFIPNGVVGRRSGKVANSCGYYFGYPVSCCPIIAAERNEWDVFGYPRLLDPSLFNTGVGDTKELGISEYDFQKITHRLQLVVNEPSSDWDPEDTHVNGSSHDGTSKSQMENLKSTLNEEIKTESPGVSNVHQDSLSFYNICLSLCPKMIINPGQKVKVCVGFPAGFDYESLGNGTTFKAYHYKLDKTKDPVEYELEEIKCEVTPLGLIIECDAFSPFAIAEVDLNEEGKANEKNSISFMSGTGGAIYNQDVKQTEPVEINDAEPKTYKVKADNGYVIDSIKINSVSQKLGEDGLTEKEVTITPSTEDMKGILVEASFIPNSVSQTELSAGKTENTTTEADQVEFKVNAGTTSGSRVVGKGEQLVLSGDVTGFNDFNPRGTITYIWKKGNAILQKGPQKDLLISSADENTAGTYTLEVIYELDGKTSTPQTSTIDISYNPQKVTTDTRTVTISLNPTDAGTVRIDGSEQANNSKNYPADYNQSITVQAVPNNNSSFAYWEDKDTGERVSTNSYYTFNLQNINRDYNLIAHFNYSGGVKIDASASPAEGGTVTIGGSAGSKTYYEGDKVDLNAKANEGYTFVGWIHHGDDKVYLSNEANYTFTVEQEEYPTFIAEFEKTTPSEDESSPVSISLDKKNINLTTLKDGISSTEITATITPSDYSGNISWVSGDSNIAEAKGEGKSATVTAVNDGVTTITVTAGNVSASATVTVSSNKLIADSIEVSEEDSDHLQVVARNVRSNPAISGDSSKVSKVSIFTWSHPEQSDMNAKEAKRIGNSNDYYFLFPINENPVGNFYVDAGNILIHVYAATDTNGSGDFIGSKTYNWGSVGSSNVKGTSYSQNIGFITPTVGESEIIGTTGESRQMEGVRLASLIEGVDLVYSVHAADIGWIPEVSEGQYAGTMHENRQLEAVKVWLTGPNANKYKIAVEAHVADKGWLPAVGSGEVAGTTGEARRLEAVRITISENK